MFTILKTEYFKLCGFYKSDCTTELVNYQNLTLQTLKNDNILKVGKKKIFLKVSYCHKN